MGVPLRITLTLRGPGRGGQTNHTYGGPGYPVGFVAQLAQQPIEFPQAAWGFLGGGSLRARE